MNSIESCYFFGVSQHWTTQILSKKNYPGKKRYIFRWLVFHCHVSFLGVMLFVWQTDRWNSFFPTALPTAISSVGPENDGTFYMPWEDFATIYDTITICPVLWRLPIFLLTKNPTNVQLQDSRLPKSVVMLPCFTWK